MKFDTLHGQNLYSFLEFTLNFDDYVGVTTIILGKNKDQKTANAAGKSSIIKSLFWVLFNKELNEEPLDKIINRNATNGALAYLTFTDRGNHYKITRYKDYKGKDTDTVKLYGNAKVNGSGVEFLVNGEPLHGDSHTQTQKIIEQKIRISARLFLSAILTPQNSKYNFLTANDTEKKELLSELLDLQAFAKAFENIKKEITDFNDKISGAETKLENYNNQVEKYTGDLENFLLEEAKYEAELVLKKDALNKQIEDLSKEIAEISILAEKPDLTSPLKKLINDNELEIKRLKTEIAEEPEIFKVKLKEESDLLNINNFIANFDVLKNEIDSNVLNHSSKIKPTQNKEDLVYTKEKLEESSKTLKIEVFDLKNKLKNEINIKLKLSENNNQKNNLLKEIENINHLIKEVQDGNACPTCKRKFELSDSASSNEINSKYQEELLKKQAKIDELVAENILLDSQLAEISTLQSSLNDKDCLVEKINNDYMAILNELSKIELVDKENSFYQNEIKKEENKKTQADLQLVQSNELKVKIEKRLIKIQAIISDFAPLKASLISLEDQNKINHSNLIELEKEAESIRNAQRTLKDKKSQQEGVSTELMTVSSKVNPYKEVKEKSQRNIDSLNHLIKDLKKSILNWQEELKYLNFWKIGFAPTGIRSFITDDVIELFNRKTQENLNDLFDGALTVLFDPESTNAKGVVKNQISTTFLLNGQETPFGMLSGGEQRRAILATNLALTEIAEARSGTKFNIRFLDEPFDGIDDNGQVKSLTLFSRLAREKDGFFIISHEEKFQNLCQKALYITKNKEISKIVAKEEFDRVNIHSDEGDDLAEELAAGKPSRASKLDKLLMKKKSHDEEDY